MPLDHPNIHFLDTVDKHHVIYYIVLIIVLIVIIL